MKKEKRRFVIFVVDDDPFYNSILTNHLKTLSRNPEYENYEIDVKSFYSSGSCIESINFNPDVVLLDYFLEETGHPLQGLYVLNAIKEDCERCKVVLMSQRAEMLASIEFLQQGGAYDYIVKNTSSLLKISNLIEDILQKELT
ncbi:MAG: response regulator [Bacteroidetes bacterium]|nr:response regulator [Bacteroidota bacterium]HET6245927.1 response regulator [Bacteroidia bacterium]